MEKKDYYNELECKLTCDGGLGCKGTNPPAKCCKKCLCAKCVRGKCQNKEA